MKFNYYTEVLKNTYSQEYNFHFSLTEGEIRRTLHTRGLTLDFIYGLFPPDSPDDYRMRASIEIIRDSLYGENVDLGIDYKKKYEELVELLEPYKEELVELLEPCKIDDMPPKTTLKMILKYNK